MPGRKRDSGMARRRPDRSVRAALLALVSGIVVALAPLPWGGPAIAQEPGTLGLPVDCTLGRDCFVQQMPDMDAGPERTDPFCGIAAYDGHTGTDFRVLSLADLSPGVDVVAAAPGTVLRVRDGEADRLVATPDEEAALKGRECGNGVLIEHADGLQTLICHMRASSISVAPGDRVERGAVLGQVGASGLAAFPHVEFNVLRGGERIDPFTGRAVGGGCERGSAAGSLWTAAAAEVIGRPGTQLLSVGLADGPVDAGMLAEFGPPALPAEGGAVVVYGWGINLRDGDAMELTLSGPEGTIASDTTRIDGDKAQWIAFAGRRTPGPGPYSGKVRILRDGEVVAAGGTE